MQSISIVAWKDLVLDPFLLILISLQFDTSGCVLIYCKTLSSSILADTRVTKIWHFLLEEILLLLLVPTTIDSFLLSFHHCETISIAERLLAANYLRQENWAVFSFVTMVRSYERTVRETGDADLTRVDVVFTLCISPGESLMHTSD